MLFFVPGNAFGWLLPAGSLGAAATLLIILIAAGRGGFSPHRMLLAGMALSTAFTMLLMMLQASGDPRMAQILTWISGSTYSATPELVMRSGVVMLVLLALTPLCRRWLTILPLGGRCARQLLPAHFLERRQRMASRRHQHQLVFEQAHAFQRDGTGHLDAHAKVQLARMQRMQQAVVGHVRQDDFHFIAMLLAVARHHYGRHRHGRRNRADADAVPAAADGALDIGKRVACRIQ